MDDRKSTDMYVIVEFGFQGRSRNQSGEVNSEARWNVRAIYRSRDRGGKKGEESKTRVSKLKKEWTR